MNKKNFIIILISFFTFLSIFIFYFEGEIFDFFINNQSFSLGFILIYLIFGFFCFLTPLPATLVIILTGFFFNLIGFFISIMFVLIGSAILFIFARNMKVMFNLNFDQFFPKKVDFKKIASNNYSILISRYIIPYFFHNIFFGLENIKIKRFLVVITFAEIPMIYALNALGMSLSMLTKNYKISLIDMLFDINFYVPFIIMIIIFVAINHLKQKFII